MGPSSDEQGGDQITGINVTPLVDIVLVLLIIFMLTAAVIANPAIKVDLPRAATGEAVEFSVLGITVTPAGDLYLNDKPIDEAGLYERVRAEIDKNPETQALIAADNQVVYGRVVRVIDLVKRAGLTRFALNIQADEG